jgi:hypothetical protein
MLAFLRIQHHGELPLAPALCAVAAACLLAYLSWRFVEQPLRRTSLGPPSRTLLRYAMVVLAVALAGGLTWVRKGFPERVPAEVARADAARADWSPLHGAECHHSTTGSLPNPNCVIEPNGTKQVVAVWGDSHALAFSPAVQVWAESQGLGFMLLKRSGCPPLTDVRVLVNGRDYRECSTFQAQAFDAVTRDPRVRVVVLVSHWTLFTEALPNEPTFHLMDNQPAGIGHETSRRVFAHALRRVSAAILAAGKELVVIGPIPEMGVRVPDCLVRRAMPFGAPSTCSVSAADAFERRRFATREIESLPRELPATRTFFPATVLCGGSRCVSVLNGEVLYLDDDHLTSTGARLLAEPLADAIASQRARAP